MKKMILFLIMFYILFIWVTVKAWYINIDTIVPNECHYSDVQNGWGTIRAAYIQSNNNSNFPCEVLEWFLQDKEIYVKKWNIYYLINEEFLNNNCISFSYKRYTAELIFNPSQYEIYDIFSCSTGGVTNTLPYELFNIDWVYYYLDETLPQPTNPKQYIKPPEAPSLEKQEIPLATKVWEYQSGSWIILSAYVTNPTSTQLRLEFEVYRLWALMPSIQLNTNYFSSWTGEVIVPYLWVWEYYWKVRTKDLNGLTSDWVDYNTNYPWEYDYTLFEWFEPYPYGYRFSNNRVESWLLTGWILNYFDTNFPFFHRSKVDGNKWDIFDNTFDTSIFTNNQRKKIAAFDAVWLNWEYSFIWGSCYWMATSASMQYKYPNFMNTYFPWFYNQVGSGTVWNNLNSPRTTSSNIWNSYNDILSTILSFQLSQKSVHVSNAKKNWIRNLNDMIIELKNNPQKRYILLFWGTREVVNKNWKKVNEAVWHAVVPYKVEWNKIYFWDNNYPAPYANYSGNIYLAYNQYVSIQNSTTFIVTSYNWKSFTDIVMINLEDIYNSGQKRSTNMI